MGAQSYSNEGLTFKDIWEYVKKSFPLVVVCVLILCFVVGTGGIIVSFSQNEEHVASGTLEFSYVGIESGLDPSGATLNSNNLKSTYIINTALKNLNFSDTYSTSSVRSAISVTGIVPASYQQTIDALQKEKTLTPEELNNLAYHPTSYCVQLNTSYDKDWNMSDQDALAIVNEVMRVYLEVFRDKYISSTIMDSNILTEESIAENDFAESLNLLTVELDKVSAYIANMVTEAPYFMDEKGNSFVSMQTKIYLYNENISTILASIKSKGIARDKAATIDYLTSLINQIDKQIEAKNATLASIKDFLSTYSNQYPNISLGSGTGTANISLESSEAYNKMFSYQQTLADQIENLTIQNAKYSAWKSGLIADSNPCSSEVILATEDSIITINTKLSSFADDLNSLSRSYNESNLVSKATIGASATIVMEGDSIPWAELLIIAVVIGIGIGLAIYPAVSRKVANRKAIKQSTETTSAE